MPYIIDGHNLIPHIPGLNLSNLDDEDSLISLLQVFSRETRKKVEVFFDRANPGHAGTYSRGTIVAHFIHRGQTADMAIITRLKKIGKAAPNWIVVTSDNQILGEARSMHFRCLTSQEFSNEMISLQNEIPTNPNPDDKILKNKEIEEWLKIFGDNE